MEGQTLQSRVIKTENIDWRKMKFLQSDNFKDAEPASMDKLQDSILDNNFTQPFYVWETPGGIIFCLDGKHRVTILEGLANCGVEVPELLPATFIRCEDKKEASKLVLIYSSIYAKISNQGLFDFIKEYDLKLEEFKDQVDFPEFSFDRFEQKFDVFGINNEDTEEEVPEVSNLIVNHGDAFQLGNHRIVCGSFMDDEVINLLMDGLKARILITDPPYNLSATDINVTGNHDNFVMGYGEMSDKEFESFLQMIMATAKERTVDGSIHYIFMDWRHCWHMTEAAKKVYGSYIPKQLIVWNKDIMANGSFYRAKHELCFIFKSGQSKHLSNINLIDRVRTNIWDYPSANSMKNPDRGELKNHPTPKPVVMIADAILDTTVEGDAVLDFFLGSGTTLIAAEKTNRRCFGTEIEPKYIQSIILRYASYCKKNNISPIFKHLNGTLTLKDFKDGQD